MLRLRTSAMVCADCSSSEVSVSLSVELASVAVVLELLVLLAELVVVVVVVVVVTPVHEFSVNINTHEVNNLIELRKASASIISPCLQKFFIAREGQAFNAINWIAGSMLIVYEECDLLAP